uniref:3'-5' exonuclease domain-containing protein n=1 Tax=Oryza glumipatula TaxID=40148 RepID=A0A0D9Y783_9ORYZ
MVMTTTRHTVRFGSATIDTTVTSDVAAADEWARGVRAAARGGRGLIVGLDCEWKPNHVSWKTSKVAVLQLCAGERFCLVLQLFYANRVPPAVADLLGDPSVRLVGIGVGEDAAKLEADYGVWTPATAGSASSGPGRRLGLKGYAREVLGMAMEKPRRVTMSNWEKRELDAAQVEYACIDAYVSYKLGERVLAN